MSFDVRRKWFASLASLTYPASPGRAAEAFKAYLPMLADMPDAAFTQRSLEAVVDSPRKMAIPAFDEVRKPLRTWWRDNRPFVTALPAPREPDRPPPTEVERGVIAALTRKALGEIEQVATVSPGERRKVKAAYLSDGQRLVEAEAAIVAYAEAKPGTREDAFHALAISRRDGLRKKLGLDEYRPKAAE
jgi:hypothetical protein